MWGCDKAEAPEASVKATETRNLSSLTQYPRLFSVQAGKCNTSPCFLAVCHRFPYQGILGTSQGSIEPKCSKKITRILRAWNLGLPAKMEAYTVPPRMTKRRTTTNLKKTELTENQTLWKSTNQGVKEETFIQTDSRCGDVLLGGKNSQQGGGWRLADWAVPHLCADKLGGITGSETDCATQGSSTAK